LRQIDNGIGKRTTITYKSSTDYLIADRAEGREWAFRTPFPVNVVASIQVFDGQNSTYIREMTYHDAYYDGDEKEFRGFNFAEQREVGDSTAPDLFMAYTFDTGKQAESLKGKPLKIEARTADGDVFHRESYIWNTRKLAQGTDGDPRSVTFPFQQEKTQDILEKGNGTPVQLKWEYEYDDYGNMTRQTEYGRMDEGWDDERVTETTYTAAYPSGLSNWILGKVVESKTMDENGSMAAHQRNYYDKNTALGEVSKGNLTQTESWVTGDQYAASVRNDYDNYGNIIAIYDPLYGTEPGHYRELKYDDIYHTFPVQETIYTGNQDVPTPDFNGFNTSYKYDTFGRLTSITKPPDMLPTVEYDYMLAHSLSDGKLINWVETRQRESDGGGTVDARTFYDGLGRKIMTRAEGEKTGQIVITDTVQFNARKQPWKNYLPYFETGTLDFTDPTYHTGFTEHLYDAMGRDIRMNQPDGTYSETIYEPLAKTVHDEEQTQTDSLHSGYGMRYVEDGLADKDGNARLRKVYEIVKLSDAGEPLTSPVEWRTTYTYDLLHNLTGYTDSQNNQKFMEYDGLGRKTFMNDPDRGRMTYEYDNAGNLVRTTDAKGQVILYEYDGVNRLTGEYYGQGKAEPDVAYHYDAPFGPVSRGEFWAGGEIGPEKSIADAVLLDNEYHVDNDVNNDGVVNVADVVMALMKGDAPGPLRGSDPRNASDVTAENTKGFLSWVQDQSGEEHNSYDARGRVAWTVKRIAETGSDDLRNFYTGMAYDAMDRVTTLTYPDSSYVTYTYNPRGMLESVPNVIEQYDYNPSGQNALLKLACGTEAVYDYDERLRLIRLNTVRSRDDLMLQDLSYIYDSVSNITRIDDGRTEGHLDIIGGELGIPTDQARKFNATQSFAYDSLYRLTQAANASVYGTITYRYDRIGNMVAKNASLTDPNPLMVLGSMISGGTAGTSGRIGRSPGDQPGPHAITGTEKGPDGAMSFTYDDNGNMTIDRGMTLSWDYKDRLTGLVNGAKTAAYLYDYTDTRKRKNVSDAEDGSSQAVLYIDKFSEIREGNLIKYVYAGMNRVARSDVSAEDSALSPTAFYLHDHLGSSHLSVSDDAEVGEQMVNYPFGTPRLERQKLARTDYKFTGKERDGESGLQYFEARYLCSLSSSFTSADIKMSQLEQGEGLLDIIGYPQRLNLYSYTKNNPTSYIDPSGQEEKGTQTYELTPKEYNKLKNRIDNGEMTSEAIGLIPGVGASSDIASHKLKSDAIDDLAAKGLVSLKDYRKMNRALGGKTLKGIIKSVVPIGKIYKYGLKLFDLTVDEIRKEKNIIKIGGVRFKKVDKLSKAELSRRQQNSALPNAIKRYFNGKLRNSMALRIAVDMAERDERRRK